MDEITFKQINNVQSLQALSEQLHYTDILKRLNIH